MSMQIWYRKLKQLFIFEKSKLFLILGGIFVLILLAYVFIFGLRAWLTLDSFYKQLQLSGAYLQVIIIGAPFAVIYGGVFVIMYWYLLFGGGFAKFQGAHIRGRDTDVLWSDVIGMQEAKLEALELVELIKDRTKLKRIGGQIIRGILMIGPPGCGKTYLAKAIATESSLPFISLSGSEFVQMFVGVGASRVRSLFKKARANTSIYGGCIIFIDELDAVGAQRAQDRGFGGQTEFNTTLNQLLVEMDGLKEKDYNIVIIGATNAPESFIDQALLRPGRFDRKIYVDLPNLEERKELFEYYLKKVKYDSAIDIARLARTAVRKSPADVSNIIREASLIATRHNKEAVTFKEISEAIDRIDMGIKHKRLFNEDERRRVAYHEAGHAIVMYFLHPTTDVFKASIASRGEALGAVVPHPREELSSRTKEEMQAEIKTCLGSYAAERLKFNTSTTGVSDDFRKAMTFAHLMVWTYGMGKSGLVGDYGALEEGNFGRARFRMFEKSSFVSEKVKEQLNKETQEILQECLKEVEELLKKEFRILDRFAEELLKKEELDYDEIEAIFKEFGKERKVA